MEREQTAPGPSKAAEKGHARENYNAIEGTSDDVVNSNRFYHWGALLEHVEYLEQRNAEPVSK